MPQYIKGILTVTQDEIVPDFMEYASFRYEAHEKKAIKIVVRGARGRQARYAYDSLPKDVREAFEMRHPNPKKVASVSYLETLMEPDDDVLAVLSGYEVGDGRYLPTEAVLEYYLNARVLNAVMKATTNTTMMRRAMNGKNRGTAKDVMQQAIELKGKLGHSLPDNIDAFRRVLKGYQENGAEGLISGKWGNHNRRLTDNKTEAFLNSLFASMGSSKTVKLSPTTVAKRYRLFVEGKADVVNRGTGEVYNAADYANIKKPTIVFYLSKWRNAVVTEKVRSGDTTDYKNKYVPYAKLGRVKYSGAMLSIDDRQPPFKCSDIGGKRVWYYMGLDLSSEAYTTWVYGKYDDKNGDFLMDFYRQMVRNCMAYGVGIPYELECESSLNRQLEKGLLQEGLLFQKVNIYPNSPNSKAIERYFREMRYGLEKEMEGFVARPFARWETNQKAGKEVLLPYNQIIDTTLNNIEVWNNMSHSKYKDKTRWDIYMDNQYGGLMATPNWRMVLPHMGHKTFTSVRRGEVKLQMSEYLLGDDNGISLGSSLIQKLDACGANEHVAYWLDDNDGEVMAAALYTKKGDYLCRLHKKPEGHRSSLDRTSESEKNRHILAAYRKTVDEYVETNSGLLIKELEVMNMKPDAPTPKHRFQIKRGGYVPGIESHGSGDILPPIEEENSNSLFYNNTEEPAKRTWHDVY